MKRISSVLIASSLFIFNGCTGTITSGTQSVLKGVSQGMSSALKSMSNAIINIKPDTSVILLSTEVNDTRKIIGKGELVFKNLNDGSEDTLILYASNRLLKKLKPGKYKIVKWNLDTCEFIDINRNCKDWHNFEGKSTKLGGNTFTIKKGDVLYLGHASVDPVNNTLTFTDNYSSDIVHYRNYFDALKNRKIKDIEHKFNINHWNFNITGINMLQSLWS